MAVWITAVVDGRPVASEPIAAAYDGDGLDEVIRVISRLCCEHGLELDVYEFCADFLDTGGASATLYDWHDTGRMRGRVTLAPAPWL